MERKYKLELIGITYNQIESGVYALILKQCGSSRRIPIIIGFPEAQAIECKLQEIKTPRPLTHDIMIESLESFDIRLDSVLIKRLPNGVFAADLYLSNGSKEIIIDSRSSDAVALAIRTGAPIYTTADVLKEAGFDPESRKKNSGDENSSQNHGELILENMTLEELSDAMLQASEAEDYEEAARIKAIIDKKQNNSLKESSKE